MLNLKVHTLTYMYITTKDLQRVASCLQLKKQLTKIKKKLKKLKFTGQARSLYFQGYWIKNWT